MKKKNTVNFDLEEAKDAIKNVMMQKDLSYEELIEQLEELQSDCEMYIDGFKDDIKNRDENQ